MYLEEIKNKKKKNNLDLNESSSQISVDSEL